MTGTSRQGDGVPKRDIQLDHDILVRNFVRAGLSGTDTRQPLCFRDLEAAVLCFPVVKAPLADTLTTPRAAAALQIFSGGARVDQYREKVQSLQANSRLYAVRS